MNAVVEKALPKGWQWVHLEDISTVISKGTTPTTHGFPYTKQGVAFLRAEDVNGTAVDPKAAEYFISTEADAVLSRSRLFPGDFLITIAGTLGRVGYIAKDAPQTNCNQAVAFARLKQELVDSAFLCFACRLDSTIAPLIEKQAGGALKNLNLEQVRGLEIPLPPLPEQKRIAAILTERLAAVEQARKASEARLEAARALPAAYLREVFESEEAKGWPTYELGTAIRLRSGEFLPSHKMDRNGEFAVYGGNGINGRHSEYMFDNPTVVIGRVGALCGCVHLTEPRSWVTDNALTVSEHLIPLDDRYLCVLLEYLDLRKLANQMGQPVVSSGAIYSIQALIPDIKKQELVANNILSRRRSAQELGLLLEAQTEDVAGLRGSLLRQAFSGAL